MKNIIILLSITLLYSSCSILSKTPKETLTATTPTTDTIKPIAPPIYRSAATRKSDIIHTKLDVSFNWEKQHLYGKATITAKPYFYPTATLILDAKGMDIKEVLLMPQANDTIPNEKALTYVYEDNKLSIELDKEYTNAEQYTVFISYTAKPNELEEKGGSSAITDEKGLYFINPTGEDGDKPKQIWTQGEIQSSSVWFPTIDEPNERMTQEIYMTVNQKYTTLSNGELVFSIDNPDSTRTDYWKMDLPHAPYLAMMTVGEFAIVKDSWKEKEVSYYVEKKYEPYARSIFGNTPEMLEFYSNLLGVEYPWNKYSQVVVRDFVSGAMENTTAALFGEFLQKSDKELLDRNYEYIVAHELFHHWFGDLVTCESWSNIPLNESFATYGEYLWEEYKYGLEAADYHSEKERQGYFREAKSKQVDLIRFDYDKKADMFDRHSYNKGGQILHMLRKYVGDEAFFAAFKLYLTDNEYNSVEIHNLRLAFEEVTGEDLNWFFNQWFLASGHPDLLIETKYDSENKKQIVRIQQKQDFEKTPLYKLPITIDMYMNGKVNRENITITNADESFEFDASTKPDLVNVDAEKMLLCEKEESKSVNEWTFQYKNAPLYLDRKEALQGLIKSKDSIAKEVILTALADSMWSIRNYVIKKLDKVASDDNKAQIKTLLTSIAKSDKKSAVRKSAIDYLSKNYEDDKLLSLYKFGLKDTSYQVMCSSIKAIAKTDSTEGLKLVKDLESESNYDVLMTIGNMYADYGSADNNDFFVHSLNKFTIYTKMRFISVYSKFVEMVGEDKTTNAAISLLKEVADDKDGVEHVKEHATSEIEKLEKLLIIEEEEN